MSVQYSQSNQNKCLLDSKGIEIVRFYSKINIKRHIWLPFQQVSSLKAGLVRKAAIALTPQIFPIKPLTKRRKRGSSEIWTS